MVNAVLSRLVPCTQLGYSNVTVTFWCLLGSGCAFIKAVQPPGYDGVQAGLLHQGVAAHVALPTPHQIASLPLASRLHTVSASWTASFICSFIKSCIRAWVHLFVSFLPSSASFLHARIHHFSLIIYHSLFIHSLHMYLHLGLFS